MLHKYQLVVLAFIIAYANTSITKTSKPTGNYDSKVHCIMLTANFLLSCDIRLILNSPGIYMQTPLPALKNPLRSVAKAYIMWVKPKIYHFYIII